MRRDRRIAVVETRYPPYKGESQPGPRAIAPQLVIRLENVLALGFRHALALIGDIENGLAGVALHRNRDGWSSMPPRIVEKVADEPAQQTWIPAHSYGLTLTHAVS